MSTPNVRGRVERAPMVALVVAVAAVSTSAIMVRWTADDTPKVAVAFYRVLFMTALVAPVAVSRHGGEFRRLSRRDAFVALATGGALAVHFVAWFESLARTTVAASVTLVQSQPVFVALGAAFVLGERFDRRVLAGMGIALVGAAAMALADPNAALPRPGEATLGNALAVLGAVMMAVYVLVGRSLRQRVGLFPYVTLVYGAATVVLGGAVLVAEVPFSYPPREFALFAAMAVGPGLLGHTVLNWALEHVESSVVSVTLLGEPVGSTVLAVFLLGEVPVTLTIVGGGAVLGGIYLAAVARESGAGGGDPDADDPGPTEGD